jgi:hypothetical protein
MAISLSSRQCAQTLTTISDTTAGRKKPDGSGVPAPLIYQLHRSGAHDRIADADPGYLDWT